MRILWPRLGLRSTEREVLQPVFLVGQKEANGGAGGGGGVEGGAGGLDGPIWLGRTMTYSCQLSSFCS